MKSGIKARLIWSYLLLILLTVLLFEAIILFALHFYYLESVKQALRDQGVVFSTFYEKEIQKGGLQYIAPSLLQEFNFRVDVQAQLIDHNGEVLASRYSSNEKNVLAFEDISTALKGETGYFKGISNGEKILAVSQPLAVDQEVYGSIRLITSMEAIDKVFRDNLYRLIGVGLFVLAVAAAISYFIATSITKPINNITKAAEQMATGNFATRVNNHKTDELGKLADTLNYMAGQVEKHEKIKNDFIASVSHDLRTPLTSVKGWAITLHAMSEDPLFREGLEIISNESERLSIMVGDLLDLSSLSSGGVEYRFTEIPIHRLIQEVFTQLKPRAQRNGIHLLQHNEVEAYIVGDANRLKQVFINLLDNALKFTPKNGEIIISSQKVNKEVFINIKDTGTGIPEEELPFVIKKFHKGKSNLSGTGLGLAICQEIIQAHKGKIELKSTVGIGTIVEVSLPIDQSQFHHVLT